MEQIVNHQIRQLQFFIFTQQNNIYSSANMSSSSLFTPITFAKNDLRQEMNRPILVNQFTQCKSQSTTSTQSLLMLTQSYLVLYQNQYNNVPTHYCLLTFAVKSQFLFQNIQTIGEQSQPDLKKPLGIKLQSQKCSETSTFYTKSAEVLNMWMIELEKKINQRNFHKLFKAKKKIGKGAFATVYLAERLRDRTMVAVKAFSKQKQFLGDKGRESLQNQIILMRHINHPNIMRLQGVYETQNSIYVILEYLQGVQLNDILKSKKLLTYNEKSQIVRNLLKALQYLSENRIIHRDLKPENIMFRNQDSTDAVICDFGLATFADAQKYLFVRCGTPGFVSPQIINIKDMTIKSDPISDVFSVGLIFHYLLLGQSIFPGKKYNEILCQNRACDFDFSQALYRQINNDALDLLKRMLEKDPSKRISSKKALSHPYFKCHMDIQQKQKKVPLKELSYNQYLSSGKKYDQFEGPSTIHSAFEPNKLTLNLVEQSYKVENPKHFR